MVGFSSPPTLEVASGGSFELWPELMPIPVSTRGLLTKCSDRFGANLGVTGCALPL